MTELKIAPSFDENAVEKPRSSPNPGNDENGAHQATSEASQPQNLRRSNRRSVRSIPFEPDAPSTVAAKLSTETSMGALGNTRRNPKRKASDSVKIQSHLPANLLEESLRPLSQDEIEEWEGWIELESEPAFFNIILRDLGISNVKAQELFTLDQTSVDFLPKPVLGLIFLFEYQPDLDEVEQEDDLGNLWFANQVTQNACATVALLNIVMNVPKLQLGAQLKAFRDSTLHLSTALRGHLLSSNTFIRTIHNSFTRRIDHLNADLALENEASQPRPKKSKTTAAKKARTKARKKVEESTYGYHFVAYVPVEGHVWELDGLKSKPRKLGPIDGEDWTAVARPQIEARMRQYESSQLSFNLLALCQSPLIGYSREIARALASLRALHSKMSDETAYTDRITADETALYSKERAGLDEFRLSDSDVENSEVPDALREILSRELEIDDAHKLYQELLVEAKSAMGEYRSELVAMAEDEQRVSGRKRDFGPALHKWVTKLAEKGVLEDIINAS